MRRPSFFRKRSNSLPAHRLVNIPAEEAGLIFSAAERAAARRRRPLSESTPSPSARLYEAEKLFPSPLTSNPPDFPPAKQILATPSRAVRPSPLAFELLIDEPHSRRASTISASSAYDAPLTPGSIDLVPMDPASPKRVVPNFTLKAYADSLFQFTHTVLETHVPQPAQNPGLLVPRLKTFEPSPPTTPDFSEPTQFQRPQLVSRFSDWSMTNGDVDSRAQSQWASALHTPEEAVLMSPDSFFAEITPRVANFSRRDVDTAMDLSLAFDSRASSPTQGSTTYPVEPSSYFHGFDGASSLVSTSKPESPWPLKATMEDVLRSPSTPASLMQPSTPAWHAGENWMGSTGLTSSASDTAPYHRRDINMPDPSFRPPSWLIHAIG